MYSQVHDPITVKATFRQVDKPGVIPKPVIHSFIYKEKEYIVNEVTLVVRANRGRDTVWMISVATDTAAFKLRFETDTLLWYMEELTWDDTRDGISTNI